MYRASLGSCYRARSETEVIDVCTLSKCADKVVVYTIDDITVTIQRTLELCRCRIVMVCHRTGLLYGDIILQVELQILTIASHSNRVILLIIWCLLHIAWQSYLLLNCTYSIHELLECQQVVSATHIDTWLREGSFLGSSCYSLWQTLLYCECSIRTHLVVVVHRESILFTHSYWELYLIHVVTCIYILYTVTVHEVICRYHDVASFGIYIYLILKYLTGLLTTDIEGVVAISQCGGITALTDTPELTILCE